MAEMGEIIRQAVYNCRSISNIIHGPEVWIAITIWASGAFCGICVMWLAWGFDKERKK